MARMKGDAATAQVAFTAARARQEEAVRARPDDGPILCVLGLIDAALGRKEEALREGHRALELAPIAKDSWTARTSFIFMPSSVRGLANATWRSSNWKLSRKSRPVRLTGSFVSVPIGIRCAVIHASKKSSPLSRPGKTPPQITRITQIQR